MAPVLLDAHEPYVTAAIETAEGPRLLHLSDGSVAEVVWHGAMRGYRNQGEDKGELRARGGPSTLTLVTPAHAVPHGNCGRGRRVGPAPALGDAA